MNRRAAMVAAALIIAFALFRASSAPADTGVSTIANPLLDPGDPGADTATAHLQLWIEPGLDIVSDPLLNAELREAQVADLFEAPKAVPAVAVPP